MEVHSLRRVLWAILIVIVVSAPQMRNAHAGASRALCIGRLHVTPAKIRLGGAFTVHGDRFSCRTPTNRLFPAAVILYQPRLGFAIFTAQVASNGTYTLHLHFPKTLIAVASLNGGRAAGIPAKPGTYYLTVRLSDVYLPPPAEALAHIDVVR